MALDVASGTFLWAAADTVSTVKTITPGFTAKVVLLFACGNPTATDNVNRPAVGHQQLGVACNKGTPTQHVVYGNGAYAVGGNQAWGTIRDDSCLIEANNDGSTVGRLGSPVFNSTTVDFTVQAQANADARVSWIAIGGSDLSDYAVVQSAVPGGTGNLDITGLGFDPTNWDSIALVFGSRNAGGSLPISQNGMSLSFGAACALGQAVFGQSDTAARAASVIGHTGEVFSIDNGSSTAVGARASFSQWITDGLRLNFAAVSSSSVFFALVMKGPQWRIGDFTTPSGTGTFTPIAGIPQPRGLLMFGTGVAETTPGTQDTVNEAGLSFGLAHATTTGTPANRVTHASAPGSSGRGRHAVDYDSTMVETKDSSGNTLVSAVDVSINADGFTPNKTLGSSQTWVWWATIADYIAPPPPPPTLRWLGPRARVRG
jgi:hypothetical protein